ncbi:MAG: dynamin family protein [Pseudomonadota bacterium]
MNAEPKFDEPNEIRPVQNGLLRSAYQPMSAFAEDVSRLEDAVEFLGLAGGKQTEAATRKLRRQIREYEPSVTIIGQVKAGKTTLVNALVGWPDMLPADVNPWTSVVTSLHLDPRTPQSAHRSSFRFFDETEWNNLVQRGGRVGELASRAGAHQELEKVREQLQEMREKSRQRLGKKFELLMGQHHEYGYFDEDLLQRYICLGDDLGDPQEGRFADITKSADLYFGQPELQHRLCFRDTPGVNDTFMIREQITINAIRESRLCVVVLSAHQALSTVDMALIRLISNIKSRGVIIFVNRIDELQDPANDTRAIRTSILETLKAHNGPTDAEVIFGSAYWAVHALNRDYETMNAASGDTLVKWAEARWQSEDAPLTIQESIWKLSGVPDLCDMIARRLNTGDCADFRSRAVKTARNIATGIQATQAVMSRQLTEQTSKAVPKEKLGEEFEAISQKTLRALNDELSVLIVDLDQRLTQSRKSFLGRATASLIKHLEIYGDNEIWTYDPTGLRLLLRSGYQVFVKRADKVAQAAFQKAATDTADLYTAAFRLYDQPLELAAPGVPDAPAPVILGSTIALDVRGNWWTNWWRRKRSYSAFASEFAEMIDAEIEPFVTSLVTDHARAHTRAVSKALEGFLEGQRAHLLDLASQTDINIEDLRPQIEADGQTKTEMLNRALGLLSEFQDTRQSQEAQ